MVKFALKNIIRGKFQNYNRTQPRSLDGVLVYASQGRQDAAEMAVTRGDEFEII